MKNQIQQTTLLPKVIAGLFVLMIGSFGSGIYLVKKGLHEDSQFLPALQKKYHFTLGSSSIHWDSDAASLESQGAELKFPSSFKKLKVHTRGGNIRIHEAPLGEIQVHFNYSGNLESSQILSSESTNDEIILSESPESQDLEVQIEIPEGGFDQIEFTTASGDFSIEKLKSKRIVLHSESGDVHLSKIAAEEIEFKTASGSLNLYGSSIENLKFKSVSGDAQLESVNPFSFNFESVSGSLKALFDQDLPVHSRLKTISGNLKSQLTEDAGSKIKIYGTTVSGDMKLVTTTMK